MKRLLAGIAAFLCLACLASAQLVQVQSQGTVIANFKKFGVLNFNNNMTCTAVGVNVTCNASSTASTAFSGLTASTNSSAGTFAASGNTWDYSAAAALKIPTIAAYAPTADGLVGVNTTNHLPVFGSNGNTLTYPASNSGTTHQFFTAFNNQTGVFSSAQPACGDLSNAATSCSTDATNATNISSGTLAAARLPLPTASTLGGIESYVAVSHQWINAISTSGVPSSTQPACGDLSNSSGGCTMSTTAGGDLSGTLPSPTVAAINGNSVPSGATADQTLIGTAASTLGWKSIPNCTGGACALTYATASHGFGSLTNIVTGSLTSGRVEFSNGANSLTDSANLLYAAASGFTQIQGANGAEMFYATRATDTTPSGNFLHFQNAAASADLFKVDVSGNTTAASYSTSNPAGNAGMLSLVQGTAPTAVANAVNFLAPTSVTTYTLTFPAAIAAGLFRTSSGGAVSFAELSGDATTTGSNVVTVVKVDGVSYAASPSTDTTPIITAANTATYTAIPNCNADSSHAEQYNTTAHTWACAAITATAAPAGSDTQVQYDNSGALGASAAFTFNKTDTVTIGVAGTTLGKLAMAGNTSGTTTIEATAAASGVLTLPAVTTTLLGDSNSDTTTTHVLHASATGFIGTFSAIAQADLPSSTNHQLLSGANPGYQNENNPQLAAASSPAAITQGYTNDGTTGTSNGLIAKLNGNDQAVKVGTSDTEAIGIVVSGGATSGTAQIADSGTAACTFDNTSTAGHYVQISTGTAGDCHDAGATLPTSGGTIIGRVADGGTAGSHNVAIALTPPGAASASGGGLFLFGNCSGNESAAGTWGVMSLGLVSNSGQCTQAWSNLAYTTVSHACTLKNLYANSNATGANASDGAVTAWTSTGPSVALTSSALTCTMGTGQACNDTTHTVSLSAGSIVSVKIVTQTGTTMGYFSVGMECD